MAGFFDDTENTTSPVGKSFFDDTEADVPERTAGSTLKDIGISLAKGTLAAGQGVVGLADIPTGGRVGKSLEDIGIKPAEWQKDLSTQLSPAQQAANLKVDEAKGFLPTVGAMLENPSTIAHGIVETLPSVAAGGALGRGALAVGSKFAPKAVTALGKTGSAIAASSVGEGMISAGQTAEQIREATPDKLLTGKQAGLAAASGVGTAAFSVVGGSLAKKLGFADVDTMIVSGLNPAKKEGFKGVVKSIVGGGITEGVFEELPQTIQETIFTNAALDKPLLDGVPEGAAKAIILGGVMGAGANLVPGANVGPVKTEQEIELERRAGNILALNKDQFNESTQKLSAEIKANDELMNDPVKFDQRIREQNIAPAELIKQIIAKNKDNQDLLNKINSGVKARDEQKKEQAKKEYDALSPEEKAVKDVENKLNAKRQEAAININDQINAIDDQIANIVKETRAGKLNLANKQTPEEEQKLANDYIRLNKEKNQLLDRFKESVPTKDFAPYTTREGRQKGLEELFGTANPTSFSDKDAAESAKVFEEELSSKNISDYVNHINNVKAEDRKQYLDQLMTKVNADPNAEKIAEYTDYIKNNLSDIVKKEEAAKAQEAGEKFYTQLFAEEKRPFNIDAYNEVTQKSAADSANALDKAGMFKGQASLFTDERQVPLTDQQQILVDKNNFEIAKLTEQKDRTIDRDERINLLNQINVLEKDNATIRTSVEQFDALEEDSTDSWYSALENAVNGFQQKIATPAQWKGMIKGYPGIKQEELDWIGLDEWLDSKDGKVSKDELVKFIAENNVKLEEVVKDSSTQEKINQQIIEWENQKENIYENLQNSLSKYPVIEITRKNDEIEIFNPYNKDFTLSDFFTPQQTTEIIQQVNLYHGLGTRISNIQTDARMQENDETKYSSYQLPGGKNYKELLITAPNRIPDVLDIPKLQRKAEYKSAHWEEPNILAHIRFNERTDANGNKVLFIEEVQSDWHQQGRKDGYQGQADSLFKSIKDFANIHGIKIRSIEGDYLSVREYNSLRNKVNELNDGAMLDALLDYQDSPKQSINVPDAPFKKSWPLLAMKRMIRYAAENEFDKIAWTTGQQQFDRYPDGTEEEQAKRLEGMKGFYDQMLPAMLNKEFNRGKWGNARVEQIDVGLQRDSKVTKEEAIKAFDAGQFVFIGDQVAETYSELSQYKGNDITTVTPDKVLSLPITNRMKSKALREGMPMFELGDGKNYNSSNVEKQETNLGNILTGLKSANSLTGQLANFISGFIPESKLNIKVVIDPNVKSANYVGGKVNTITLRDPAQLETSIHEITHAVTSREMKANPAIRDQVLLLMKRVELKAIKEALITPAQVQLLRTAKTSKDYKNNIGSEFKYGNVAYGLLNENEFLAQAMGNEQFQKLLKATTIADKGKLRNAWDAFVKIVMKALGIKQTNKNAFGEALSLIAKLASQENVGANTNLAVMEELGTTEPVQKISDETYNQMFTERNSFVRTIGQTLRMRGGEIKQLIDKGLGSISTRLKNVDPMLRSEIRNLDFRTSQNIVSALRVAHPLLEKTKTMSPEDKFVWDAARRNSDEVKIKQIADKYGMTADQERLREVLNKIRQDAIDVGYDVGFIDEYWPRIIKDQEGFLQATKGISQRPVITDAIKRHADKLGMSVERFELEYPEQAADIASNTILGRNLGIGGPGNIQARQYETVPPELNKFYMDSDAALMQYIYSMTKKIEARKFFGRVPERIAKLKAEKKRKSGMLAEYQRTNNNARINELSEDLISIEQQLDKYKLQRDYTENIGTYINDLRMSGRIQADDEKVVRDILDARFHEHGTTGIVNAYKNMAYIDVMGSPISALTQIGDLAWAMYVGKIWTPKGLASTVKNIGKAITKKSEITKEDLGIERIAQEFADGTTLGNAVSWVFKKVYLEKIDSIGKEVLINNALDNYKVMASTEAGRTNLLKQLKPIFGTQSDSVINDLLASNPTDNVKMLLYHRLLDFQPVALSEMPEVYLKSGNGRIAYMLKTYTIKQFDVFRNEVWHNIKSGEKDKVVEGITNMIKLVSLLTLANAGADELKDFMLGKDVKFEDHVIENFLTMGGGSRYLKMQVTREGLGSGLAGQILPPFRFINSISKDLNQGYGDYIAGDTINFDHARIVESIPIAGKLYYWNYGRGEDYKKSSNEQEFGNIGKDVDLFKRQLENSGDKRTFLNSNLDKFKQMKLHENFKKSLARNQAVINKLKDLEQTTNVRERLGQLKQQREVILNKYFEVAKSMQ